MPWGKNNLSEIKNIGLFCSVNCVYIPQHNSSHRPAGRSSMFNTPFTVWTRHRASTPGMGGGSSPSEGWTILQQESPNPGWKPKSGRRGIGGEWQRWLKVTRQSHRVPLSISTQVWLSFQKTPTHLLGVSLTLLDLTLNKWATQVRCYHASSPSISYCMMI